MEFLKLLEGMRTPVLNGFFSGVTYLGDEIMVITLGILLYWCFEKRYAYYVFCVGLLNTLLNQTLKSAFRIPRPWVLDPEFTIVESARAAATGYSFPSGHTQNAVGMFGAVGLIVDRKPVRAVCLTLIVLVPFSRMYLGVHTPLDVGTGFAVAAAVTLLLYPCFKSEERASKTAAWMLAALFVCIAAFTAFMLLWNVSADIDLDNLAEGRKAAFIMLAVIVAVISGNVLDVRMLHTDRKGSFLTQAVKVVLGLGILLAIRALLKAPLNAIVGISYVADGIRYLIIALFATCVWPLTFPLIKRICERKRVKEE